MCLCLFLFFFSFKDQEHTFNWEDLTNWEADDEAMAFCFEYSKGGKKPRWVKIYSQYVRRYVELSAWLVLERERERKRGFPSTEKRGESAEREIREEPALSRVSTCLSVSSANHAH